MVFVLIPRRDSGNPGFWTRISHPTVHRMPSQVSHGRLAVCARIQEGRGRLSRYPATSICDICENSQPLGLIAFLRAAHNHHHQHQLHPVRRARATDSAFPPWYLGTPRGSESMTPAAILAVVLLSCLAIASFAGYKARQVYRTAREEAKETRDTAVARRRLAALQADDDPPAETAQEEQELREIRSARRSKQDRGPLNPPPV